MIPRFAKSKSGHDKDHYYVIIKEDNEYVYLSDGRLKPMDKCKKKNKKHIQVINDLPEDVVRVMTEKDELTDLEIKRAINLYTKRK